MADLDWFVKQLTNERDQFALDNPHSEEKTEDEFVGRRAAEIVEELMVKARGSQADAQMLFEAGTIFNVANGHEPRAELMLSSSLKLDPSNARTWLELGKCIAKRNDIEMTITCFEESVKRRRTAESLSHLSVALRTKSSNIDNEQERRKLREKSVELAEEAIRNCKHDEGYPHLVLATGYFVQFFASAQLDPGLIDKAKGEYLKALSCDDQKFNADLHLNLASTYRYSEDFTECLKHAREAVRLDVRDVRKSRDNLNFLVGYLQKVAEAIKSKARKRKRILESFCTQLKLFSSPIKGLSPLKSLKELKVGVNEKIIFHGKVIGEIPRADYLQITIILCDENEEVCALTIYNTSFQYVIGDTISVIEPCFNSQQVPITIDNPNHLIWIRCTNSRKLLKNGVRLSESAVALAQVTTRT